MPIPGGGTSVPALEALGGGDWTGAAGTETNLLRKQLNDVLLYLDYWQARDRRAPDRAEVDATNRARDDKDAEEDLTNNWVVFDPAHMELRYWQEMVHEGKCALQAWQSKGNGDSGGGGNTTDDGKGGGGGSGCGSMACSSNDSGANASTRARANKSTSPQARLGKGPRARVDDTHGRNCSSDPAERSQSAASATGTGPGRGSASARVGDDGENGGSDDSEGDDDGDEDIDADDNDDNDNDDDDEGCLLYTSPSPRDQRGSRMPSSA